MAYDDARGWLVGEENRGLPAMFVMMNEARLGTGLQGHAIGSAAYQAAAEFARERLQGRSLTGTKNPDGPADPIIVHPDVRRMLLTQKVCAEGGRALAYHACTLIDIVDKTADPDERKRADELLSFLTPIVKGVLTELAVECTYHALQVFGGHGYIKEWGMEQFARDARITTIYEGTTQIQGLDLLARKVMGQQAAGLRAFLGEIASFCNTHRGEPALARHVAVLEQHVQEWQALTQEVGKSAIQNADEIGAAAVDYLWYCGYISIAYFFAREVAALGAQHAAEFREAKQATAGFWFDRILPRTLAHAAAIRAGAASLMAMPEAQFGA